MFCPDLSLCKFLFIFENERMSMDTWHLDPGIALSDCGMPKRYIFLILLLVILLEQFINIT